ncbi:MAG: hypothetical protein LN566_01260 [Rickettsia endosymbiont of Stiretrus anchorago]|nr:hypothetical protein [Rickettsia endosymbiont of Stiretrus anchorago]
MRKQFEIFNDPVNNPGQIRNFINDIVYKKILDNELSNLGQIDYLSKIIATKFQNQFIDQTVGKINYYSVDNKNYYELIAKTHRLVNSLDNPVLLKATINEIANLEVVKENPELRGYLAKTFFVLNSDIEPQKILELYDNEHQVTDFRPELVIQAQDNIFSQILSNIKADISQKIYRNDCLLERYLPVHGRGIKNTEEALQALMKNDVLPILENNHILGVVLERIIEDYRGKHPNNLPSYQGNSKSYEPFEDNFKEVFFKDDFSFHKLLITSSIIKNIGVDNYISNLLTLPLKESITQVATDFYNMGTKDKLYLYLSKAIGESVDLNTVTVKDNNSVVTGLNLDKLYDYINTDEKKLELLTNFLVDRVGKTYYDIEKETYKFRNIHTKQSMQKDSYYRSFDEYDRSQRLFRNHIETRQHQINNTNHEAPDLQLGDTHYSNISYTIIPDIAISYASNGGNTRYYSWIEICAPQKAVNTTEYMENNLNRKAAQEFITSDILPNKQLAAVKIEKIADLGVENKYKIVDGFVSRELYDQIQKDKLTKLKGIEDKFQFFLTAAYLYHDAALKNSKPNLLSDKLEFTSLKQAEQNYVSRTDYQNIFDQVKKNSIGKRGNIYNVRDLEKYHKKIREQQHDVEIQGPQKYYDKVAENQVKEKQFIKEWQKNAQENSYEITKKLNIKAKEDLYFEAKNEAEYLTNILQHPNISQDDITKLHEKKIKIAVSDLSTNDQNFTALKDIIENSVKSGKINPDILFITINAITKLENGEKFQNLLSDEVKKELMFLPKSTIRMLNKETKDDFLKSLITSFDFIDTTDILNTMTKSHSVSPWQLYATNNTDSDLLNWQKALESKNKNTPKEQFINCYEI